jgi:CheY-like chemotaxis protein
MDRWLPGMDGLELTRRLKGDPATCEVVLAVTACAMRGDEARAPGAGCDGSVPKPMGTRTLPGVVAEHLARARSRGAKQGPL